MSQEYSSYGSDYGDNGGKTVSQETEPGSTGVTLHETTASEKRFRLRVWIPLVLGCVLYVVSFMSLSPLSVQYMTYRIAKDKYDFQYNESSSGNCGNGSSEIDALINRVQKEASQIILESGIASGIPSCFTCLIVGSYSDYLGRKPLFLASIFGGFIRFIVLSFIIKFDWNIRLSYIGAAIDGITGSYLTMILAATAIIADITPIAENRALNFAVIEGFMLPTAAAAQIGVGYLIRYEGYFLPQAILSSLLFASLLIGIFFLPETVQIKRMVTWNPKVHLRKVVGFYIFNKSSKLRRLYLIGLGAFTSMALVNIGRQSVELLYELNHPVCWNSVEIGIYSAIKMVGTAIVTVIFLKLMKNRLALEYTGMICAISGIAGFIAFGFSQSSKELYLAALVSALYLGCIPIPRALLSQLTPATEQGALFSGLSLVETVSSFLASTVFAIVYNNTINSFSGAVFMVIAAITLINAIFLLAFRLARAESSLADFHMLVEPGMGEDTSKPSIDVSDDDSSHAI